MICMIIDADTDPGLVVYTYVYTVDPAGAQGHHPPTMTVAMETSPPRLEYVDSRRRAAQRDVDEGDYHEDGDGSAANMESPGSGRNIARHTGGLPSSVRIEDDTSWVAGGGVGYHMQVHTEDGGRWMVVRRYSEFALLREAVVARCHQPSRRSSLLALQFPEKRWLGSADLDTVRERRRELERWMNGTVATCPDDNDILAFLAPHRGGSAGDMTPGGTGSFSGASGALGADAEDWAELEKVRQLRQSLLEKRGGTGLGSTLEPEPEQHPPGGVGEDDLLEMLIREAADDAELDAGFSLPSLQQSGLDGAAPPPGSPAGRVRHGFAAYLSQLETPPRNHDKNTDHASRTPPNSIPGGIGMTPRDGGEPFERGPESGPQEPADFEWFLGVGGKLSLLAICDVLDGVVPMLDMPQTHTPRRRRRLLEERVEKLLELLRPTESGNGAQQRWAAAAALMQFEPKIASELAGGLATLAALPKRQPAYLSASAVVTLASVLRTLEVASAGRNAGNLLEQEVMKKLGGGGEGAVTCVAAVLEHSLELVDKPQEGISRRYRRALEHDILEAQSCLERGLGFKLAGRGLQPPLLEALVVAIVEVQQLVPSELGTQDATDTPMRQPQLEGFVKGLMSEDARRDQVAEGEGQFGAMQRLLRLLVRPDSDPEVLQAQQDELRVTEQRVARRREQRITAVLARNTWGPADEEDAAMPSATERLVRQREEEAAQMLRMRQAELDDDMRQRQKEVRQARLSENRKRRVQRRQRRLVLFCVVLALASGAMYNPAARERVRAMLGPTVERVSMAVSPALERVRVALGPVAQRLLGVWMRVHATLGPVLYSLGLSMQTTLGPVIEVWATFIDRIVAVTRAAIVSIRLQVAARTQHKVV